MAQDEWQTLSELVQRGFERLEGQLRGLQASVDAHDGRFDAHDKRFDAHDKRFDAQDKRFDAHDKRFDAHDKRFDDQDARFDRLEARLDAHDQRFDRLEADLERRTEILVDMIRTESAETRRYMRMLTEEVEDKIALAIEHTDTRFGVAMAATTDLERRHDARLTVLERRDGLR